MELSKKKMCRTCMVEAKEIEPLHYIYDLATENATETIADLLLTTVPQLHVQLNDALPKIICKECLDTLLEIAEFRTMCLQSECKLLEMCNTEVDALSAAEEAEITFSWEQLVLDVRMQENRDLLENNNCSGKEKEEDPVLNVSGANREETEGSTQEEKIYAGTNEKNNSKHSKSNKECCDGTINDNIELHNRTECSSLDSIEIFYYPDNVGSTEELVAIDGVIPQNTRIPSGKEQIIDKMQETETDLKAITSIGQLGQYDDCTKLGKESTSASRRKRRAKKELKTRENSCKCGYCVEPSTPTSGPIPNLRTDLSEKVYRCEQCPQIFLLYSEARMHSVLHNDNEVKNIINNKECSELQINDSEESHVSTEKTQVDAIQSAKCPEILENREELTNLINKEYDTANNSTASRSKKRLRNQKYVCEYCNKGFRKLSALQTHLRIHSEKELYFCLECPEQFTELAEIHKHVKNLHQIKQTQNEENQISDKEHDKVTESTTSKPKRRMHQKYPPDYIHKCEFCNKGFKKRCMLQIHLRRHTGERPYLCTECGKAFIRSSSLQIHMKRHKADKLYECPDCPKKFSTPLGLREHKVVHTKIKQHICEVCGSAFGRVNTLRKHEKTHTGEKPYKCDFCDMRFASIHNLRRHQRTHTGEKPYKCKYCTEAFRQGNNLTDHLRRKHLGENIYRCELCPQIFPLARDARAHFASHKNDDEATRLKNLKALQEEEAKLNASLTEHGNIKAVETKIRSYNKRPKSTSTATNSQKQIPAEDLHNVCEYCNKGFTSINRLLIHLQRHKDEKHFKSFDGKEYECPECPKKFRSLLAVNSHKDVHAKTKPHVCDVCGAAFVRPFGLRIHKERHTGHKPYECENCDKRFTSFHNLRRHQRTHTGEKPYKCNYCTEAFRQGNNLTDHLRRKHLGENIYRCELCPQIFPLARDVREHLKSHKNDDEATRLRNFKALQEEEAKLKPMLTLHHTEEMVEPATFERLDQFFDIIN